MAGTSVENSWTGPQLYMQTPNDGADQTAMNGWLTNDAPRAGCSPRPARISTR